MIRVLLLALLWVALEGPATASPRDAYSVSLVTVGPGATYWERFGHNALLVRDRESGRSISYNYGIFDFRQENFLWRFIRGRMLYRLAAFDGDEDLAAYQAGGRRVSIQELNLEPDQVGELLAFLEWNRRPENAAYRYDYFRDNCSTRIRDALDRVLNGALEAGTRVPAGRDYRWHVRRLTAPEPWLYTGTQLGLGRRVDQPITDWDTAFLPMELARLADQLTLADGRPLVRQRALLSAGRIPEPAAPPRSWPVFLVAGLALAALCFWRTGIALTWWALSGTAGVLLASLWWFTDHWAAQVNENLLVLSPLAWAVLLAWGHARPLALASAAAVAGCGGLALIGHLLDWLPQDNLDILLAATPVNLAAYLALRKA